MISIPDAPPDVAVSVAAASLAESADRLGVPLTAEQREEMARAMLERAWPYLDGVGPDPDESPRG